MGRLRLLEPGCHVAVGDRLVIEQMIDLDAQFGHAEREGDGDFAQE